MHRRDRALRGPRVLRGVLAASVATFVALMSHLAGGGAMPGWVGVLVPWVLAVAVCTLLAGRTLSLWRVALAVAVSQFLFHGLFVLGMFDAGATATLPAHHAHHAPVALTPVATDLVPSDTTMWVGHLVAAVVTVAALHRGERAVRGILTLAGDLIRTVRRRLATTLTGFLPQPRRPVTGVAAGLVLVALGWHPSSVARRGPPFALSV